MLSSIQKLHDYGSALMTNHPDHSTTEDGAAEEELPASTENVYLPAKTILTPYKHETVQKYNCFLLILVTSNGWQCQYF